MKLLFITRKYPPSVGGMQQLCYYLAQEFNKTIDATIISWGKSQKLLPLFLVFAFLKSCITIPLKNNNLILLGDALLSPLGLVLKILFNKKTCVIVHGLDITFNFPLYQLIIPKFVSLMDCIICNSNGTLQECLKRGISAEKCIVISCGVYPQNWIQDSSRSDLEKVINQNLLDKKVLITVGRLVKRKGVHWFIKNVFLKLGPEYIYLIVGDGPEKMAITNLINKHYLQNRVLCLGKISQDDLKTVYNNSDLFVMPNIKIKNDLEGFGIVAIEASATGLPVLASRIDGIMQAVTEQKNGYLVTSKNASEFIKMIPYSLNEGKLSKNQVKKWVDDNYNYRHIVRTYLTEFSRLVEVNG